ncbi:MAG: DUF4870 domain-containing protein [Actinomycetota bacterium]
MQNMSSGKTALGLENNIGALVCYAGNLICAFGLIYSIIVITQDKTNKLPRFHAFQSVILNIACLIIFVPLGIILAIVLSVIGAFSGILSTILGGIIGLVFLVLGLGVLYFVVMAAIKAYNGEIYKIPFVGDYAEKYSK